MSHGEFENDFENEFEFEFEVEVEAENDHSANHYQPEVTHQEEAHIPEIETPDFHLPEVISEYSTSSSVGMAPGNISTENPDTHAYLELDNDYELGYDSRTNHYNFSLANSTTSAVSGPVYRTETDDDNYLNIAGTTSSPRPTDPESSKYYDYVERYALTLKTAYVAENQAGHASRQEDWGREHWQNYGANEGRILEVEGEAEDTIDYGAYVENYGTTLLDIYRIDARATVNGGSLSKFEWGKEHYSNWGQAEGRESNGGIDWGAIVRNNTTLYDQWQAAKALIPNLSAFAYGNQNQYLILNGIDPTVRLGGKQQERVDGHMVYAEDGNDIITGTTRDDILSGGFGDDLISNGGGGTDTVYGGPGSDVFRIHNGGTLLIRDFRPGADFIQLGAGLGQTDITASWDANSNSTLFQNGTNILASIYGITPTQFSFSPDSNGVNNVYI